MCLCGLHGVGCGAGGMDNITIVVPIPDNLILWAGIALFGLLLGVRVLLGFWEKVKP